MRHHSRPWHGLDLHGGLYVRYGGYHGRHFDIPRVIVVGGHGYSDYYYDRSYYEPHGHWHEVYVFPVYHRDRVAYRPYHYCEGRLYARSRFDLHGGLSISLELDF